MSSISSGAFGSGGGVGNVKFLQTDDAVQVGPTASGVIYTAGAGTVFTTGNAGTNTATFHVGNGTTGQVLTSAGAGQDAVWADASAGITIAGDSGSSSGNSFTFKATKNSSADATGSTWSFVNSSGTLTLNASNPANGSLCTGELAGFNSSFSSPITLTNSAIYGHSAGHIINFSFGGSFSFTNCTLIGATAINIGGGSLIGTSISNNVVVGSAASGSGSSGRTLNLNQNSVVGEGACLLNFGGATTITLNNNAVVGYQALGGASSGLVVATNNVAVGYQSLQNATSPSGNVALGYQSGQNYTSNESNNILIGNSGVTGDSAITRIGFIGSSGTTTSQFKCFIDGISGVTTDVNDAVPVLVDSAGQLGVTSSSARYKENIKPFDSSAIMNANAVQFNYKDKPESFVQYGLIAEEVDKLVPEMVVYDKDGNPDTIKYQFLPVFLLAELQKALKRIEVLESRLGA